MMAQRLLVFCFLLFIPCFFFHGCAKLQYMEQALTLKGFADNKSEQRAFVEARDALFEHLLSVVEKGMIDQYQNSNAIKQEFGEPLLVTQVMHQGEMRTRWLYRYQTQAFSSPKVYLIFNNHGVLEEWELVPAPQSNEE